VLALSLSAPAQVPRVHLWAAGDSVGVRLLWTLPFDRPLPREYVLLRRDSRRNVYEPLTTVQRPTRERWTPWIPADVPPGALDTLELFINAAETPPRQIRCAARSFRCCRRRCWTIRSGWRTSWA